MLMNFNQNKSNELAAGKLKLVTAHDLRREDGIFFVGGELPVNETLETMYESFCMFFRAGKSAPPFWLMLSIPTPPSMESTLSYRRYCVAGDSFRQRGQYGTKQYCSYFHASCVSVAAV